MAKKVTDIGASVRMRLKSISTKNKQNHQLVLTRYANERLLYRLSKSEHADSFVLKGAVLLMTWLDVPFRGSRDIDFLGCGDSNSEAVLAIFKGIFAKNEEDGVCFDAEGAVINDIREHNEYDGLRIKTTANIDGAQISISIDVGFGDAMVSEPQTLELQALLPDMPTAKLLSYDRETVIAEKFHAMVNFGLSNSRLRDYYDVWLLSESFEFNEVQLARAIVATFKRRKTVIPTEMPEALTAAFGEDKDKQQKWNAFILDVSPDPGPLQCVIEKIKKFLIPALKIAASLATETK